MKTIEITREQHIAALEARVAALEEENARLKERLETRKLIERAKGVLMRRHHWSEGEAYRALQCAAMNRRTTMAQLARRVIEGKDPF